MVKDTQQFKFLDTFAGMGGLRIGLENGLKNQGVEPHCIGTAEIKPFALKTLGHVFPDEEFTKTDITQLDTQDIPDIDGLIGGFPCFPAGTKITTDKGYKNIEDIEEGDVVLTHTNKFKKVLHTMKRTTTGMYHLHVRGSHHTKVTGEHPYYVRYFSEVQFKLGDARWVNIQNFTGREYVGYAINQRRRNPYKLTKKQVKTLGQFYAGDDTVLGDIKLSESLLTEVVDAYNKTIPFFIIDLPKTLLKEFYDSYKKTKGNSEGKQEVVTAPTSEMAYVLAQIILKLYQTAYTITYYDHIGHWEVDYSEEVNQGSYYIGNQVWQRIDRVGYDPNHYEDVYNFEVQDDNSYVANQLIVHNCQTFSYAGNRAGFEDTRGTLFYELARIMKDKQPRFTIFENVQGLIKHDGGRTLETILNTFKDLGYHVTYQFMDAKDYGLAGSRPRIYIVCHRDGPIDLTRIPKQDHIPFSAIKETLEPDDGEYAQKLAKRIGVDNLRGVNVSDKKKGRNVVHSWEFEARGEVTDKQIEILEFILGIQTSKYFNLHKKTVPYVILYNQFNEDEVTPLIQDLINKKYIKEFMGDELGVRLLFGQLSGRYTRIIDESKPLPTLTATDSMYMGVVEGDGVRGITYKEALTALGYPEDYTFPEDLSPYMVYDLLGNTVAPPIVTLITEEIIKQEREFKK